MNVELHSIVHDWTAATMLAEWLAQSWLDFWRNNGGDDINAIIVEVWETSKTPYFVALRLTDNGHILKTPRIIW
jgi:hypothetical protein